VGDGDGADDGPSEAWWSSTRVRSSRWKGSKRRWTTVRVSATAATRATSRTERASARDSSIRLSIEEARDDPAGPGVQAEDKGPGGRAGGGMETPTMLDHNDTFPVKTSAQVPQAVGPRSSAVGPSRGWDPVLAALAASDRPDGLTSWPPPVTRSALDAKHSLGRLGAAARWVRQSCLCCRRRLRATRLRSTYPAEHRWQADPARRWAAPRSAASPGTQAPGSPR
jgi:hypothetical protein